MANFSLSLWFTAIWVFILTIVGIGSIILEAESSVEIAAIASFFFLPSLILSLAFMGQGVDQKERSDFRGTVGFLTFLLLSAICVGVVEAIWPDLLPEHLVAVGGGSLGILVIMSSLFLIVDGGLALKSKASSIYLVSSWLAILSVALYIFTSIVIAREGFSLQDFATAMKSMTIAFSLVNLSFLWMIIKQKPEEVSEAEMTQGQAPEEEASQEEEVEVSQEEEG